MAAGPLPLPPLLGRGEGSGSTWGCWGCWWGGGAVVAGLGGDLGAGGGGGGGGGESLEAWEVQVFLVGLGEGHGEDEGGGLQGPRSTDMLTQAWPFSQFRVKPALDPATRYCRNFHTNFSISCTAIVDYLFQA